MGWELFDGELLGLECFWDWGAFGWGAFFGGAFGGELLGGVLFFGELMSIHPIWPVFS